jgi:hypothetical protein
MPMNPRLLRPLARQAGALPPSGTPASLLLRFDGNFTDSSPNALTVTANGDAAISTATKKYGSGSAAFDGVGDYLSGTSEDLTGFGDGDWTIECWILSASSTVYQSLFRAPGELNLHLFSPGAVYLNNAIDGVGGMFVENVINAQQWHHVAAVRSSGVSKIFVDGLLAGSSSASYGSGASSFDIGADVQYSGYLNGYIDDLRIVKGLAVYTGDFVPPTAALPANATPYTNYKPYGTFLFSACDGIDLVGTYADGTGGRYTEVISAGACE